MLALITLLDGANATMFHVEHCGNRNWEFQIRWPESRAEEYRSWGRVGKASWDHAVVPLMDPTVPPEVRWRWDDGVGPEEEWQDAVPREWGPISAEFHVIVKQPRDFREDPLVHAATLVRRLPSVFELAMPRRMVAENGPEIVTVTGRALVPGVSAVLREAGEFTSTNDAFSITNAGPSQVTLRVVEPRAAASLPYAGVVALRLGKLPPGEIELLRAYVAARETPPASPHA